MTNPPAQHDYGRAGDETLVPGTLRVFRSFLVDAHQGVITPMNYHPERARYMHAQGQHPYHPFRNRSDDPSAPYEAACTRGAIGRALAGPDHRTPDVDCTCGFYASYDQVTDFYPSFRWGRNYVRMAGDSQFENFYAIRAVCEVSGRVVMGRRGVRAERMKIVAIAVDWDKYMRAPEIRMEEYYDDLNVYLSFDIDRDVPVLSPRRRFVEHESDDRGYVGHSAPRVAADYGVKLHGSVAEMLEAYPAQDVSHLVDTTPKPPERPTDPYSFYRQYANGGMVVTSPQQWGHQAAAYAGAAQGLNSFRQAVQDAVPTLSAAVRSAGKAMSGISADFVILDEATTVKDRALQLKKNRPAPPGTGIDRRRGKLR